MRSNKYEMAEILRRREIDIRYLGLEINKYSIRCRFEILKKILNFVDFYDYGEVNDFIYLSALISRVGESAGSFRKTP